MIKRRLWIVLGGLVALILGALAVHGAAIEYRNGAFFKAAEKGDAPTLNRMLQKGCPADVEFEDGSTPLSLAVGNDHTEAARVLLEAGADSCHKDHWGKTPMSEVESEEMRSLLRRYSQIQRQHGNAASDPRQPLPSH